MPSLFVTLQGGTANQACQYAAATKLAKSSGHTVVCDLSFLELHSTDYCGITPRVFSLNSLLTKPADYVPSVPTNTVSLGWEVQHTPQDNCDYRIQGYWQRLSVLPNYEELRDMFVPPQAHTDSSGFPLFLSKIKPAAIGIHIRRTDYLNPNANAFHGVLGIDYYQEAISLLKAQNSDLVGNRQLVVYSDDVPWCKEHLVPKLGFEEVLYADDYISGAAVQLYSMAYVPYFAIANSSFSWLGRLRAMGYGQKSTVYPRQWFSSGLPEGMMPAEWHGI